MQVELTLLKPKLIETSLETERIVSTLKSDSVDLEMQKKTVDADEVAAKKKAQHSQQIKNECEESLGQVLPVLQTALDALDTLKAQDISLLKSMKNPPASVKLVMEAVCVLKDVKPGRIKDPSGSGKMIDDYWTPAQVFRPPCHRHHLSLMSRRNYWPTHISSPLSRNLIKKILAPSKWRVSAPTFSPIPSSILRSSKIRHRPPRDSAVGLLLWRRMNAWQQ